MSRAVASGWKKVTKIPDDTEKEISITQALASEHAPSLPNHASCVPPSCGVQYPKPGPLLSWSIDHESVLYV